MAARELKVDAALTITNLGAVATVAPEIVTQMLMVMVLLAFLVDVPYLTPTFDWVNAKVKTLAPA